MKTTIVDETYYEYPPEDREMERELEEYCIKHGLDDEIDEGTLPEDLEWYWKYSATKIYFSDDVIAAMKQEEDTGWIT